MRRFGSVLSCITLVVAGAAVSGATVSPAVAAGLTSVPRPDHVVMVIEENHSDQNIIGNSAAPYLNSLATSGASFSQFFAETHPSEPNYLALFSGGTQGVTDDSCPHTFSTPNLGSELAGAGLGFTGYSEGLPSVGSSACVAGRYVRKHNPWANFTNVPASDNQPLTAFPSDYSTLPEVSVVVPNLDNDMHDGSIAQGDQWLQSNLSGYVTWAKTHNSVFVLTFDEDDGSQSNQIPTIITGERVATGSYAEPLNHYNLLRTIEDAYGLDPVGASATASPILDMWTGSSGDHAPFASDTFSRTVHNGLGTADVGGNWLLNAPASSFSVAPGAASLLLARANAYVGAYLGPARTDADAAVTFALDRAPVGGAVQLALFGRRVSAGNGYLGKVLINANRTVTIRAARQVGNVETALAGPITVPGLTYTAGAALKLRVQVTGTSPTTVRARVWAAGASEPATWQVSATDTAAALQSAGVVGVTGYLASSVTNAPVTVGTSAFSARPNAPPTNQPPVAAFTFACTQGDCAFDGSGSSDPEDVDVASYDWDFGDGGVASGAMPSHTFAVAGTYQVTLTVTDDDGATGSVTHGVTVSTGSTPFVSDTFNRTVLNAWGTADLGGKWTIAGEGARAAVSPGNATFGLDAGTTMTGYLAAVARADTDLSVGVSVDKVPTGGSLYLSVTGRRVSSGNGYRATVEFKANGTVSIRLIRSVSGADVSVAGPVTVAGLTQVAGTAMTVRTQVTGANPTTIGAKVWTAAQVEPAAWQVSATDGAAALQAAGVVGVVGYLAPAATNGPVVVSLRSLVAVS